MTDYNQRALAARWTAVVNDEVGGWCVTTDGRTPLDGGILAAEMVATREIGEHIADLHNQRVARDCVYCCVGGVCPVHPSLPDARPSTAEVVSAARVLLNALLYQPGQTPDVVEARTRAEDVIDRWDRSQPPAKDRS